MVTNPTDFVFLFSVFPASFLVTWKDRENTSLGNHLRASRVQHFPRQQFPNFARQSLTRWVVKSSGMVDAAEGSRPNTPVPVVARFHLAVDSDGLIIRNLFIYRCHSSLTILLIMFSFSPKSNVNPVPSQKTDFIFLSHAIVLLGWQPVFGTRAIGYRKADCYSSPHSTLHGFIAGQAKAARTEWPTFSIKKLNQKCCRDFPFFLSKTTTRIEKGKTLGWLVRIFILSGFLFFFSYRLVKIFASQNRQQHSNGSSF